VIDLDQAPQYRTPPARAPKRGWQLALVLFLAGAIVGCVTTYFLWFRPLAASAEAASQADSSVVAVLLYAEPGVTTVDYERERVRIEAQVSVVNAGPVPVNVLAVRVDRPGVAVHSLEKERQIEPGTALPVDVVVEWTCAADQPTALAATVYVETADEQTRKVSPVALSGTPWIESALGGCATVG
jgi:hypothetical protein